mmetsp:Transcript_98733/g.226870  ORF Transcript_98733/g.226870 Transcript_98733/m.226870 type:complete len:420 (-) Transcript_98733:126-1385(-)
MGAGPICGVTPAVFPGTVCVSFEGLDSGAHSLGSVRKLHDAAEQGGHKVFFTCVKDDGEAMAREVQRAYAFLARTCGGSDRVLLFGSYCGAHAAAVFATVLRQAGLASCSAEEARAAALQAYGVYTSDTGAKAEAKRRLTARWSTSLSVAVDFAGFFEAKLCRAIEEPPAGWCLGKVVHATGLSSAKIWFDPSWKTCYFAGSGISVAGGQYPGDESASLLPLYCVAANAVNAGLQAADWLMRLEEVYRNGVWGDLVPGPGQFTGGQVHWSLVYRVLNDNRFIPTDLFESAGDLSVLGVDEVGTLEVDAAKFREAGKQKEPRQWDARAAAQEATAALEVDVPSRKYELIGASNAGEIPTEFARCDHIPTAEPEDSRLEEVSFGPAPGVSLCGVEPGCSAGEDGSLDPPGVIIQGATPMQE